ILCITLNPLNAAVCFAEAAAVSNGAPPDESSQPLTPPERDESKLKILDKIKEWRTCIKGQHAKGLSYFSSALYTGCADIFGPDYSDGASRDQLIGILSGYFGGLPPDTPTTCDGEQVTDQIGGIVDCFKENETVCMTLGTEEYCAENLQELYFKTRAYQGDPNRLLGPYSLAQINAIQNCALESPAFVGLCVAESGVFDPNTPLDSLLRFLTPEQAEQFITKGAGAVDSWHTCIRAGLSAGEKLTSGLWARCGDQNFGPNYKDVDPDLLLGLLLPIADLIPAGVPATCDQEPISSARGIADCFQQKEKVCLVIDGKTRCADGPVELADLAIGSFGTVLPEQDLDGTLTPEGWEIFMANIRCLAGDPIFAQLCAVADEVGAGADVGTGEETPPELLPLARCMIENSFNLVLCMAQSGLYTTPGQPDKTDEAELPAEPAVNEFAGAYIPPEKLGKIGCVGGGHAGESVGVTVSAGACIAEGGIVVDTETGDQFATTEDLCIGMTPKDGCIEIEEPIEPTETELDRAASIANDINDIKKLQTGNQTFLGTCKQNLDFGTCSQLCFDGFVYQFLSAAECVYDTVGEQAPERDWAIRTEIYRKGFFSDSLETTLDASNLDEFNRQFYGFDSVNYRQNSCVYDRISGDVAYCTSDPNFIRAQRYFNRPQ
ncbi:MAG: hypothetical protein Q8P33_03745, partial [bacterium]|nr:hypothetical protein [bacterium]